MIKVNNKKVWVLQDGNSVCVFPTREEARTYRREVPTSSTPRQLDLTNAQTVQTVLPR